MLQSIQFATVVYITGLIALVAMGTPFQTGQFSEYTVFSAEQMELQAYHTIDIAIWGGFGR